MIRGDLMLAQGRPRGDGEGRHRGHTIERGGRPRAARRAARGDGGGLGHGGGGLYDRHGSRRSRWPGRRRGGGPAPARCLRAGGWEPDSRRRRGGVRLRRRGRPAGGRDPHRRRQPGHDRVAAAAEAPGLALGTGRRGTSSTACSRAGWCRAGTSGSASTRVPVAAGGGQRAVGEPGRGVWRSPGTTCRGPAGRSKLGIVVAWCAAGRATRGGAGLGRRGLEAAGAGLRAGRRPGRGAEDRQPGGGGGLRGRGAGAGSASRTRCRWRIQWQVDGADIAGATGAGCTPSAAQEGRSCWLPGHRVECGGEHVLDDRRAGGAAGGGDGAGAERHGGDHRRRGRRGGARGGRVHGQRHAGADARAAPGRWTGRRRERARATCRRRRMWARRSGRC